MAGQETIACTRIKYQMGLRMRKQVWFPTRSGTNRPVQSQKQARSLKFRSENKDAETCHFH